MARTHTPDHVRTWGRPRRGRYYKRAHNKAARRLARAICAGRRPNDRTVAHWATEIGYGKTWAPLPK